jgi:hypothetical protein
MLLSAVHKASVCSSGPFEKKNRITKLLSEIWWKGILNETRIKWWIMGKIGLIWVLLTRMSRK